MKWMHKEWELDEEGGEWIKTQIDQMRTFSKLISSIHLGDGMYIP